MRELFAGQSTPGGSHFDGKGVNFTLYSAHAEKVELCIFDAQGHECRYPLFAKTGSVWHGYLTECRPGLYYNYRVYGPFCPAQGHRFTPQKLLLDPYAKRVQGHFSSSDYFALNELDNGAVMLKSQVIDEAYDWQQDCFPHTAWGETLIYELHVKGFSQLQSELPDAIRGTYAALSHPKVIDYLKQLGITAIELLPIQKHLDEPRLQQLKLTNYWGYNVIAPFAVEDKYWSQRALTTPESEVKDMVKALHRAGIEVILDVVFNHTAELDEAGPILSLRGIDNANYYWLNEQASLENWTGCGNSLKLIEPEVVAWVIDCLCYWRQVYHIDGFRFDLAAVLGRTPVFSDIAPLFCALSQHPELKHAKLIVEPWDIGVDGYQLGHFPAQFAEWNDHFRDDMRQFWLFGQQNLGKFVQRWAASSQFFQSSGRKPHASINFITSHDGFTLKDLVSFNQKHNHANGEQNRDGHNGNWSNNHGVEGVTHADRLTQCGLDFASIDLPDTERDIPAEVLYQRSLSTRALLASLLLAQGTPMLLAGDEFGHTQQGNNNGYCQDNQLTWLNWQRRDKALIDYVRQLIQLRKQIPALQSDNWWQAKHEVEWLDAAGQTMSIQAWQAPFNQAMQIVLSQEWLIIINASLQEVNFILSNDHWQLSPPSLSDDIWPFTEPTAIATRKLWRCAPKRVCFFKNNFKERDYDKSRRT